MKALRKTAKKVNYKEDFEEEDDDEFDIAEDESEDEEEEESEEDPEDIERKREKKKKEKKPLKQKKEKNEDKKTATKRKVLGKKRENDEMIKEPTTKAKKTKNEQIENIDPAAPYDYNKNYFYQNISNSEWNSISSFIEKSISNQNLLKEDINSFFSKFPNLSKGEHNIKKLIQILNDITTKNKNAFLSSYQLLISYINSSYLMPKPTVFEVHFFPNPSNEVYVLKMLSTCKTSMDIAIFTMTNQRIANVISSLYSRGVKCRIIADDECCKMWGSNIYSLAALGIPVKTDDSVRYHMHHKFAVIDNSVVITGSFNWTAQAVGHNQENVLFIENKQLAKLYTEEYNRLWEDFETVITKESAKRILQEQEEKKKAIESRKMKEKERKKGAKENGMVDEEKEKAKAMRRELKKKQEENEVMRNINNCKSVNIMKDITLENNNNYEEGYEENKKESRWKCLIF